jgi:exodeoxyribonuclease VII large subunit
MQPFDFFESAQPVVLTVTQITRRLRELLESDPMLKNVWLKGEVSNLSLPTSGHVYFTLKDELSSIRCVIWKSSFNKEVRTHLQEGAAVEVHGYVGIYERSGQYQLYVDSVRPAGEGALFQEFLRLKARLEEEGLFAQERKRAIPPFPNKIGLVTSPTGAALQDMLNIFRSRFPLAEVVLMGTSVQGDAAPNEIVTAIDVLNHKEQPDVILLARGGGSLEDLWAFNDERVVRAVVASKTPIITGIGHETDFTLADFAADLRAPTPTAAAVAAVPDINDLLFQLNQTSQDLLQKITESLFIYKTGLRDLQFNLEKNSPKRRLTQSLQHLDELNAAFSLMITHQMEMHQKNIRHLYVHLQSLNPYQVLKRGYAIVTNEEGGMIDTIHKVKPGQGITVRLQDGRIRAGVNKIEPNSKIR